MKMTEEQFLQRLKALQKVKGLSALAALLNAYYGEKTQQQSRRRR